MRKRPRDQEKKKEMKEWHSKSFGFVFCFFVFFTAAILGLNFLSMCPFVKEEVSYGLEGQWK